MEGSVTMENPYKVLALEKGHESTDAEIKKVLPGSSLALSCASVIDHDWSDTAEAGVCQCAHDKRFCLQTGL